MDEIKKSYSGSVHVVDAKKDIDLINQYSLKKMGLCDDQQDRDLEKFSVHALQQMAKLFPGKPMLSDHSWSALRQIGRIYKADVVQHKGITYLRGSVYMVRSDSTNDIIKSIEAGVLKEVSVGCSCKKRTCSECGADVEYSWKDGYICKNGHRKGDTGKNGKPILTVLDDVTDTYELSFVAVPAQPGAGVTKGRSAEKELSPEEIAYRKQIVEESKKIIDTFTGKREEKKSPDYVLKDCPMEPGEHGDIAFVILPESVIDESCRKGAAEAIAFARKDLDLPPIRIRWFAPEEDAQKLGLKDYQVFYNSENLLGTVDQKANDRVYIRYFENPQITKIILHEAYHISQRLRNVSADLEMVEEYAYRYSDEAMRKLLKMDKNEMRDLVVEMALKG